MARDPYIDVSQIDWSIRDGVVILQGEVETRRLKRMIEDVIYDSHDVEDVVNQIRVRPQDPVRRRISRSIS